MLTGEDMHSFWEMWLGIAIWMALSYMLVYIIAAFVSMIMLRNHPWMLVVSLPMFGAFTVLVMSLCFLSTNRPSL